MADEEQGGRKGPWQGSCLGMSPETYFLHLGPDFQFLELQCKYRIYAGYLISNPYERIT